jgi:hypothetical protein
VLRIKFSLAAIFGFLNLYDSFCHFPFPPIKGRRIYESLPVRGRPLLLK